MDVRIGVTYSPKELEVELGDDADAKKLKAEIDTALGGTGALWLTDRRGRQVAVPIDKVAYVEIGSPDDAHRIGFGGVGPTHMPPVELLDRKLVFVTGKGGVGKSTIASALALVAARRGQRTLACEFDAKGNLADFFSAAPTGWDPTEVQPNLFAMSMDTEESLKEYLRLQVKIPLVARIGPLARTLDFVANAAPGVKEILTVGKVVWETKEKHYDLVVVDASATGHVVAQLSAPQAIGELVKVGLVRDQTAWLSEILDDPTTTGAVIVAAPEEMPVNESLELAERIRNETRVDLAATVVNRVLPELFSRDEEEVFTALRQPKAIAALEEAAGGPVAPIFDAAELAVTLRRTRTVHLDRLREGLPGVPMLYAPELFTRSHGIRATSQLADALSAELGY